MVKVVTLSAELLKSILWDRPEMTPQKADSILNRPDDPVLLVGGANGREAEPAGGFSGD
jgi:hypothetical protein